MHSAAGEEELCETPRHRSYPRRSSPSSSLSALRILPRVNRPKRAQSQPSPGTVFRSGASLVALNVTVTDGKRLVPGLAPDDFAVYEDGVLQRVQFFESHEVPIDLILLIDTSASMSDKMEVVHEAAIGFLKTLRDTDRGAVVTFGDNVNILQALTSSDRPVLEQAVRRAQPHGSTALNNALYVAMKQFARSAQQGGEVRRQAIAVLSDGEDTSSVIPFDDVLAMARKSGINIYTICLQNRYSTARAEATRKYFSESDYAMKSLAQETGAQSFFPQSVQELKGIYAEHLRRAVESVFDRLLAEQLARRRPLPAHRRQGQRRIRSSARAPGQGYTAEILHTAPSAADADR